MQTAEGKKTKTDLFDGEGDADDLFAAVAAPKDT